MDNATVNIAKKMSGGMNGPGSMTDTLLGALRALQTYAKAMGEQDANSEDVTLVRGIISSLSRLIAKDQMHQMPDGTMMANSEMGGDAGMTGAGMGGGMQPPEMPDLTELSKLPTNMMR